MRERLTGSLKSLPLQHLLWDRSYLGREWSDGRDGEARRVVVGKSSLLSTYNTRSFSLARNKSEKHKRIRLERARSVNSKFDRRKSFPQPQLILPTFPMKICVFGGSGLVGSSIAKKAVKRGWNVVSVSQSGKPFRTPAGHSPAWVDQVSSSSLSLSMIILLS
jgi:hypothetical protein